MEHFYFGTLSTDSAIEYSHQLSKYENFSNPISFSFPSSVTYDPFGMLLVGASLRQFIHRNPQSERFISFNKDDSACRYAGHMGFFKSISEKIDYGKSPGEAVGSATYFPITCIDLRVLRERAWRDNISSQQQIQNTAEKLSSVLARNNDSLKETLTYVFREIIRNTEEHSNADFVWVCAQYWPSYQLVEIGLLDEGIGIKRSLKSNRHFTKAIKSDEDALKLCILPGITEAYKRQDDYGLWANSGYGLYIAKELCAKIGEYGHFLIVSGSSCLSYKTHARITEQAIMPASLKGTAICLRFSTKNISRFEAIRNSIIAQGQNDASHINQAIRKASYSSGALIDLLKS